MAESENQLSIDSEEKVRKKRKYRKRKKLKDNELVYGILIITNEEPWDKLYRINVVCKLDKKRKYRLFEARSSKEAVKIIVQHYHSIDVILIDLDRVLAPEQESEEPEALKLLKELQDRWGLTEFALFVLTADANESLKDHYMLRGVRYFGDKSQLDFERLVSTIDYYLDLSEKPKGVDVGFYVELRNLGEQSYFYISWKYGHKDWERYCLGNSQEIERIELPNVITDLNSFDDWKPKDSLGIVRQD